MPLETGNAFISEKNKPSNAPIYLYTLYEYDGTNNLYFAEWSENVTYDGQVYTAFPINHNEIGENSQNEIDEVNISLSNVSRLIQYYLENYDLRGKKVKITLVWLAEIDDADANVSWDYFIDSYTADEQTVQLRLRPKTDVLGATLPARTYSRNYCQWKFKSDECGYDGAEGECNRTKQRCRELANYSRYGGFPSIPSKQLYVV